MMGTPQREKLEFVCILCQSTARYFARSREVGKVPGSMGNESRELYRLDFRVDMTALFDQLPNGGNSDMDTLRHLY